MLTYNLELYIYVNPFPPKLPFVWVFYHSNINKARIGQPAKPNQRLILIVLVFVMCFFQNQGQTQVLVNLR